MEETTPLTVAPWEAGTEQALTVRRRSSVKLEGGGLRAGIGGEHRVGAGGRLDYIDTGEVAGKGLADWMAQGIVDFDGGLGRTAIGQHAHAEGFAGGRRVGVDAAGQRAGETARGGRSAAQSSGVAGTVEAQHGKRERTTLRAIEAVGDDHAIGTVGRNGEVGAGQIGGIEEEDGVSGLIVDIEARAEEAAGVGP